MTKPTMWPVHQADSEQPGHLSKLTSCHADSEDSDGQNGRMPRLVAHDILLVLS